MADTFPDPKTLRNARLESPNARDRDLADTLGVSEAQLLAAHIAATDGRVTRIDPRPELLIPAVQSLGEVMALTRNISCVSEKVGTYQTWHDGDHAAMVLGDEIDLRVFPSQWAYAFTAEKDGDHGTKRSLQVFDAAGDAIHKVHLRPNSDVAAWDALVGSLALQDQSDAQSVGPRQAPEKAKADPARRDVLRSEWIRMTDTHQFLRLCSKFRMNRLGAYRLVGEDLARPLAPGSVDAMLTAVRDAGTEVMIFVGNAGCIQIYSGPLTQLMPMGPWLNVMDPRFNLHLRGDHVAEVWAVDKPTKRGPALSIEAFDADNRLILQCFAVSKEGRDHRDGWAKIVGDLPEMEKAL